MTTRFQLPAADRERFTERLREFDGYLATGALVDAADLLDLLTVHARRVAHELRQAAKTPPPVLASVGDLIAGNAAGISSSVLGLVADDGTEWRRAVGEERYGADPTDRSSTYDWVTAGGWATDQGLLDYVPLRVTRVAPACVRCTARPAFGECCSSHQKLLCHLCYRRSHFAELCVPDCPDCVREHLPLHLADLMETANASHH